MKKATQRFIPIIICLLVLIGTQITQSSNVMSTDISSNCSTGGITTLGGTPNPVEL